MKSISMKMNNGMIYQYALALNEALNDNDLQMPVAVLFSIEKNKQTLMTVAQDVEKYRMDIIKKYGEEVNGNYNVPQDKIEIANKELQDLFSIEQEVNIYKFNIEDLGDIKLTSNQMNAILFMIED